ncbi:stage II sporulation protein R [Metabacillus crassostreae]|uniref:stage II sporulation protein R n=1 Tax=Metabacillus crassostreae TaxID=929098 RepID=UPI00195BBE39|nr:stage II sporulation protein R [Metabacillus crassostreae]
MKKQQLALIYIILLFAGAIANVYKEPVAATSTDEPVVIPDEAIRLRILANSNSDEDQELKRKIRDEVNKEITEWVEELTSVEAARKLIQSRLPEIESIVEDVLEKENMQQSYSVDFDNVSFPTKLYGNFIYPAGDYEAILISLGEAKGANWWCVLFPPLCFLDFSNGEAVASAEETEEKQVAENDQAEASSLVIDEEEEKEEVEVKFFLVEWIEGIFS